MKKKHRIRNALRLVRDESGTVALEYGLIIALTTLGVIGTVASIGGKLGGFFQSILAGFQ